MKIKILKTTVANKGTVRAGQVLDLSELEAKFLIQLNKAEPVGIHGESLAQSTEALIATDLKSPPKRGRKKKII